MQGREQWLLAGQSLLRRGGRPAIKLHALATEAGLTTGSFYHHFAGMHPFLGELAHFYGADQVRTRIASMAADPARERLRKLGAMASSLKMVPLDAAMRDWAGSDERAADAVRSADAELLVFIAAAFEELGHDQRSARLRARMLVSYSVARVMTPWGALAADIDEVLAILDPREGSEPSA